MSDECTIIVKVSTEEYIELTKYAEDDPIKTSVNEYVRNIVKAFLEEESETLSEKDFQPETEKDEEE